MAIFSCSDKLPNNRFKMPKRSGLLKDDTTLIESIAYIVERERLKAGRTKTEHAAFLGITIGTYWKIQGHQANLGLLQTTDIARRLNISIHELLFARIHEIA
ncbi:hypothetical protein LH464_24285 [Neorhizobium sp. T786]|uniref:hypothetical protein n=1 Tax=Pseudorhizobium xiangyangii TaxID=2883104 RepID=UPI001CFFCBA9|nr:hypothetical protein [Neorhizobium xiangyangii]MCB5205554.1 hypothetical protein [Neorhizobium xiangyangii]